MFEKEAEEYAKPFYDMTRYDYVAERTHVKEAFQKGAEFGYNLAKEEIDYLNKHWRSEEERKANERHSPEEHIDKDKVVLGIIKHCNKTRYSLVQWNGEWWYQYRTFNAEIRLIAWYNIPELKEIE